MHETLPLGFPSPMYYSALRNGRAVWWGWPVLASASKERVRNATTRGCGCPFSILGKQLRDEAGWAICHRQDQRFAVHNHEPSSHPTAHLIYRKLTAEDKAIVSRLNGAGVAPKEIRTYLRQNASTLATQKDISSQILQSR